MRYRRTGPALSVLVAVFSLCFLASCNKSRSTDIKCGKNCSSYQVSDSLPDQPPQSVVRLAIGGDSRDDSAQVVPWAFREAKMRGAKAFFFLGDLEITSAIDKSFLPQLADLGDIPFYPAMGNHEVETLGIVRLPKSDSQVKVKKFKEEFLTAPGIHLAPFLDTAVYSVDLAGGIHFVVLDNVSRAGEGFGRGQLDWLEEDLKTASTGGKVIFVGMHKGLANNPVTTHAMDEDGPQAIKDSDAALSKFKTYKVAMVFVSHSHMYAGYVQDGLQVRLTGGMGAPLVKGLAEADGGFHHFLLVDVPPTDSKIPAQVQVVKFPCVSPCTPSRSKTDESQERN
jgi:Calcineurin-like phosphoesterase